MIQPNEDFKPETILVPKTLVDLLHELNPKHKKFESEEEYLKFTDNVMKKHISDTLKKYMPKPDSTTFGEEPPTKV